MNKVIVELEVSDKKRRAFGGAAHQSSTSTGHSRRPPYQGWVTPEYVGAQLRDDVAEFWALDATKFELLDGVANAVVGDDTRLDTLQATSFTLRKRHSVLTDVARQGSDGPCEGRNDPFWLQEKLFDVFLIHALPHWNGKGCITMSCYQFKQLVLKSTALSSSTTKAANAGRKSTHELTVRVVLAFKTATPNFSGAGATFDEFLDALMDVAAFLFPRLSAGSKEHALEEFARTCVVPYYEQLERRTVHHVFSSWSTMDELVLVRPKVKQLLHRFMQPLFDIALAYTTTVTGPRHHRGLQFHEFSRLIHDTKPSSVPLNTLELCFCFIHCCRVELSHGFTTPSAAAMVAMDAPGSLASLNAGADGSGRGVLEISCAHAVHVVAYLALLSMPPLALTKTISPSRDNQGTIRSHHASISSRRSGRVGSALAVLSIKAFLHFMSLRLATSGRATATAVASASPRFASMKKDTTLPLVSVSFLQEFLRMHREDTLNDYLSACGDVLRGNFTSQHEETLREASEQRRRQQANETNSSAKNNSACPEEDDERVEVTQNIEDDLSLDIDWGDENASEAGDEQQASSEDDTSPVYVKQDAPLSAEEMASRHEREQEVLVGMMNDADEIYTFLVSELQRHAAEERLDDTETVPQMLDIWVTAGQKYAQVINYLDSLIQGDDDAGDAVDSMLDRKARVLERFGMSLYVFAIQLLKSTSKVLRYEEIFHVTNARVYNHVTADLWDGGSTAVFTTDLATETLSLASGKLGAACKILEELHRRSYTGAISSPAPVGQVKDQDETHADGGDGHEIDDDVASSVSITERYMQSLLHRAHCLDVYGDVLGHTKRWAVDFDLGCALEEDHDQQPVGASCSSASPEKAETGTCGIITSFYSSSVVLAKTSSAGHFYREAKRIYRFLLATASRLGWNDTNDRFVPALSDRLARSEFKLASHLPRGCIAEKHLLDSALHHLPIVGHLDVRDARDPMERTRVGATRAYIGAIHALRAKFFQPETEKSSFDELDSDAIVPFYRFVIVAALREVDSAKTGLFTQRQLSQFNEICGRSAVSDSVMAWLLKCFDHLADSSQPSLTEKGVFQYFCWLAEADPLTFCEVLDLLTAKYTETPISITSGIASQTGRELKAKSLRSTLFSHGRQRASASMLSSTNSLLFKTDSLNGIAECVVVVSAKMTPESCADISQTASPSDVRLEPSVVDVLPLGADVPEELSKFCFPEDLFMSNEPLPPKAFDLVLTDITGARQFGSCLHFVEERDPIDVLAMISGIQRGNKTSSLPSWISLKDIQQRKAKTKFFIPKCVCILSRLPLFQTFRDCLATMYRLSISAPPFPLESFVLNILEQIPVPTTPNSITSFSLVDRPSILTSLPPAVPHLYPSEVDFTLLFQCLSAENILRVYGFLLTEKKVVLCSRNVSILTPCAETLRALLYPFECQVVYIPVLPLALLDFVTAPVPFFMGTCSEHSIDRLTAEGVVVVNLDKDEVVEPTNEELPTLPEVRAKKLLNTLRKTSAWATSQTTQRHFGRYQHGELSEIVSFPKTEASEADLLPILQQQDDLQEKWAELSVLFTTFVMRLLKDFRKYCHRAPNAEGRETTVFDRKAFLAMHPSQREFCVHLFQTQHFQRFIDTSASLSETVLQLAASDAEQSWRNVRSKSIMIRRESSDVENAKASTRQTIRAPSLSRVASAQSSSGASHRRRPSGRHTSVEILAPFNCHVYDELRGISNNSTAQNPNEGAPSSMSASRPPLLSHASSSTLMSSARSSLVVPTSGNASSNLIVAARLRLDIPTDSACEQ